MEERLGERHVAETQIADLGDQIFERGQLSFNKAQEIASTGAKVLHARCISPCRRARVPLLIKDTRHPDFEGTVIGPLPPEAAPSVKAISSRRGITLVSNASMEAARLVRVLDGEHIHTAVPLGTLTGTWTEDGAERTEVLATIR